MDTLYSNDNYDIIVNADVTGYDVNNTKTSVTEYTSESLPEAIFAAENMNVVLVHKTYEWVAKSARDKAGQRAGLAAVTPLQ